MSQSQINFFKQATQFAIVGASSDQSKFGNKVLRWYQNHVKVPIYPVNPKSIEIEGLKCVKDLSEIQNINHTSISVITPPHVTTSVLQKAVDLGIRNVWCQPGSESVEAIALAKANGINLIAGGPCILVTGKSSLEAASQ
ncbi:CoA-binding protein [Globomyces pollinis-pini]|nr:CoA-binding protein [Globomyces pollinis-pini]